MPSYIQQITRDLNGHCSVSDSKTPVLTSTGRLGDIALITGQLEAFAKMTMRKWSEKKTNHHLVLVGDSLLNPSFSARKKKSGAGSKVKGHFRYTLPEINITPENGWLEDDRMASWQGVHGWYILGVAPSQGSPKVTEGLGWRHP